jgi:hypothetical protein
MAKPTDVIMNRLAARMAAKDLNPLREALLASQAQSTTYGQPQQLGPAMQTADGAAIPGTETIGSPMAQQMPARTPQQQMILAAAQDPRQFSQLAGGTQAGALELGQIMQQAPRSREIVVHAEDELNKRLGLGLGGAESAIVKLDYDEQDRQLPGFEITQYKSSADNTEANRTQYPSGTLGQALLLMDLGAQQGEAPWTRERTENYFNEARMTSVDQQAYRRYVEEQKAAGVPESEIQDSTDFYMTHDSGTAFAGVIGKTEGDRIAEYVTKAQAAIPALASIERGFELIDKGIIAGAGAEARLALVRLIDTALGRDEAKSAATDGYLAATGQRVAEQITAFGAGTGLSDADREFARLITGGQITMTPQALKIALEILARGKLGEIQRYNNTKAGLRGNFATLKAVLPEVTVPESTYARLGALKEAPEGMDDAQKLNWFLNQRPTYMAPAEGTPQSLPPVSGQGPTGNVIRYDNTGRRIQQ